MNQFADAFTIVRVGTRAAAAHSLRRVPVECMLIRATSTAHTYWRSALMEALPWSTRRSTADGKSGRRGRPFHPLQRGNAVEFAVELSGVTADV